MSSTGWEVILNGEIIDIVWFESNMTAEEVKASLVNHDGYNPNILVRK